MAKAHGIIYSTVKSPKHPRFCGTNQGMELRKHINGYPSRFKFSVKGLWRKGEKLNSSALSQESSLLCRSTETRNSETEECVRQYNDSSDVSRAQGRAEDRVLQKGYIHSSQGLAVACKFVYNDAKYVIERARNDMVLLSRGILRMEARARQDVAILSSGIQKLDARAREDTEKIDHDVKTRAAHLNNIAIILKRKAESRLKSVADRHWSDGGLESVHPMIIGPLSYIGDGKHVHSLHLANPSLQLQSKSFRYQRLYCQSDPPTPSSSSPQENLVVEAGSSADNNASKPTGSSNDNGIPEYPNKSVNRQIAVVSVLAAVGLFLSGRLDFGVSLKDLSAAALPYEEALSNGKPTVVEFYADWCEVCRELAPDVYKVEQQYKDRVNFVMLNVDNTKWEQELDEFGVEGIPHFAFLDKKGNEEGNVVGRLPRQYLSENVDALARGEASIPHARVVGQFSSAEARKVHQISDPRSHG